MSRRRIRGDEPWIARELAALRGPCPVRVDVRARVMAAIRAMPRPGLAPAAPGRWAAWAALAATVAMCAALGLAAGRLIDQRELLGELLRAGGPAAWDLVSAVRAIVSALAAGAWDTARPLATSCWRFATTRTEWIETGAAVLATAVVTAALAAAARLASRQAAVRIEER
ncbi:MAG: hypothetical protein Kow0062_11560 [Acidobacteriota bacterium]|nr:MAG: hypothetical protein D6738_01335 [Acidobacteriota bacterium]